MTIDNSEFLVVNYEFTTAESMKKNVTTSPGPIPPPTNPLYNKYVIIGGLVFFAIIFLMVIVIYILKGYRRHYAHEDIIKKPLYGRDEESDDLLVTEDEDELYSSCHVCVEDCEVNTVSSDFEYDCRSPNGNATDVAVETNLPNDRVIAQTEALERARLLLTHHFKVKYVES